jgi:hypothetical protein
MEFQIDNFPEHKFSLKLLTNINIEKLSNLGENVLVLNPEYVYIFNDR